MLESLVSDNKEAAQVEILNGVVASSYMLSRANDILRKIEKSPFGHYAICGPSGSGKMSLLSLTRELY